VVGLGQVGSSSSITDAYGYRYERDGCSELSNHWLCHNLCVFLCGWVNQRRMQSYPGIEAPHLHINLGLVTQLMAQEPDLKRAMDLNLEN